MTLGTRRGRKDMGLAHGAHAPAFADTHMTLEAKNNNGTCRNA